MGVVALPHAWRSSTVMALFTHRKEEKQTATIRLCRLRLESVLVAEATHDSACVVEMSNSYINSIRYTDDRL